jgi:sulfur-oxidizing protein SoxX
MTQVLQILCVLSACLPLPIPAAESTQNEQTPWLEMSNAYLPWQANGDAIQKPLGGFVGDPNNGLEVAVARSKGNCIACHILPIPRLEFHGELGPSLVKAGRKFTAAQLRLRVADIQKIHPHSVMPPYYMNPVQLHRVAKIYRGHTILSAQEVEDVVAYLVTLK